MVVVVVVGQSLHGTGATAQYRRNDRASFVSHKKEDTCMVTAVANYPTYHTYLVAAQHGYYYCVGIHVLQTDKTG